jgi:hypothetical protein
MVLVIIEIGCLVITSLGLKMTKKGFKYLHCAHSIDFGQVY